MEWLQVALAASLLAILPDFILFLFLGGRDRNKWIVFVLGGAGWLAALVLRLLPLQLSSQVLSQYSSTAVAIGYAALLAGLFEEGVRYALMRKIKFIHRDLKTVLCFGLGWGFLEALLVFAVAIIATPLLSSEGYSLFELLPGVFERNMAIAMHVGLSIVVYKAISSKEYLLVAIAFHAFLDFVPGMLLSTLHLSAWEVEAAILTMTIALLAYAWMIARTKRQNAGWLQQGVPGGKKDIISFLIEALGYQDAAKCNYHIGFAGRCCRWHLCPDPTATARRISR